MTISIVNGQPGIEKQRTVDVGQMGTYELVWSDEFEIDGRPDPKKWTYETGFVRNKEFSMVPAKKNAFCENGLLIIEGKKETILNADYDPNSRNWRKNRKEAHYTSSSVTTKGLHAWVYGRFEIKAKIKTELGLWPAIWTLGYNQPWAYRRRNRSYGIL